MIAWMLYSALVGALVVVAAAATESVARLCGMPTRWVWTAAIVLALALPALGTMRTPENAAPAIMRIPVAAAPAIGVVDNSFIGKLASTVRGYDAALNGTIRHLTAAAARSAPLRFTVLTAVVWAFASAALLLLLVAVHRRFRRAMHGWPRRELFGTPVIVGGDAGPLVAGVVDPRIVVPDWLFARSADEQRTVVTHEAEHVRARDPLLLAGASIVTALVPWNPALWYLRSRLRLAVELDCDARVVGAGTSRNFYGNLLIDVAEHALPVHLDALALAGRPSHLYRRVLAMDTNRSSRFSALRGGIALTLAAASLLVACQAELPTSADIDQMDAASATQAARKLAFVRGPDSTVAYTIDGRSATRAEAEALATAEIASIEVARTRGGPGSYISIITKEGDTTGGRVTFRTRTLDSALTTRVVLKDSVARLQRRARGNVMLGDTTVLRVRQRDGSGLIDGKAPVIYIDGVLSAATSIRGLDPKRIESIEVLKGPAAAAKYPNGANGVILVKTKPNGG
jgi:TonB-dependent SusC/RagA subfamily outer membrane receptor